MSSVGLVHMRHLIVRLAAAASASAAAFAAAAAASASASASSAAAAAAAAASRFLFFWRLLFSPKRKARRGLGGLGRA